MSYIIPDWTKTPPDASTPRLLASYLKATTRKLTPLSVDNENGSASFAGRHGNYITTLAGCPCGSHPKPCKHMYRLAMILGVMPGEFACDIAQAQNQYIANTTQQITLEDAVAELENYTDNIQRFILHTLAIVRTMNAPPVRERIDGELRPVLSCSLLNFAPVPASVVMETMRKKDITAILDRLGSRPDMALKKSDLIPWCLENIVDFEKELPREYDITCAPCLRKVVHKLHTYLRRKYDFDSYYNGDMVRIDYPYGAQFVDCEITTTANGPECRGNPFVCYFPADEITELLTLYGHNRCLNGFDVTKQAMEGDI